MLRLAFSIFGGNSALFASRLIFQISLAAIFGIEIYGYFALAQSVILIIEKFKNIQPWQQLTVDLAENRNENSSFWLFFFYEILCSFFAYVLLLASLLFLPTLFDKEVYNILSFYGLYLLFGFNGSALGYLRWKSHYNVVIIVHLSISVSICAVSLLAFHSEWLTVIYAYIALEIIFFTALNASAIWKVGLPEIRSVWFLMKVKVWQHIYIIRVTHANNVIRVLTRELDVILLGLLATSATVGFYKMAKNIAHLPVFVTDAFYYSIYPEFVKAKLDHAKFQRILNKTTCYAIFFTFFVTVGYISTYVLSNWLVVEPDIHTVIFLAIIFQFPISICLATFSWAPALLSTGKQHFLLKANLWSTGIYFILYYPMYSLWGAIGTIINYGFYYLLWSLLIWRPLWR